MLPKVTEAILKSNMDRFIALVIDCTRYKIELLKSNMDRFIEYC